MADATALSQARLTALMSVTAVLFFFALLPFELIPEIPVDIDAKPFFVPFALAALLPGRQTALAIGLGVALGEGLRDVMEGYELDDPIGFVGYVVGFWVAGTIFAIAPRNPVVLMGGAIIGAGVQAFMEASSFLLFGAEALSVALFSAIGNTISHGIFFGALPMLFFIRALRGKFEMALGFAPAGGPTPPPLASPEAVPPIAHDAVAGLSNISLRYPGEQQPAVADLSFSLRRGDMLILSGPDGAGKTTTALMLAGAVPSATGGEVMGRIKPARTAAWIGSPPRDFVTAARPISQVLVGSESSDPKRAHTVLEKTGLSQREIQDYVWMLDDAQLVQVALAAAMSRRPDLLVIDGAALAFMNSDCRDVLDEFISEQRKRGAVVYIDRGDVARPTTLADAQILALSPVQDVSKTELSKAGIARAPRFAEKAETRPRHEVPTLDQGHRGWWHERDPRVKWLLFLTLILLIYVAPDWRWMAAMTGIGLVVVAMAKPRPIWLLLALFVQLPNVIGLVVLPLLGDGASLDEEFAFGLRLAFGWVAAILFGIGLLSTMEIPELAGGLRGLGLPKRFAFLVGYSFLLIYLSLADLRDRMDDIIAKGGGISLRRPVGSLRQMAALFVPVVQAVATRGGRLAVALEVNGGANPETLQRLGGVDGRDALLVLTAAAALAFAIIARFSF